MNFLHPTLAAVGLAAISLPIIIHLLIRRRVKPVRWAAMKFLMEAYKQRRRRLILEQILLLATRCLLVACIALALGRLLLGGGAASGTGERPTSLYLLIDDSLTSGADGALERHKARATALLAELDPGRGDTVSLVTLSRPAEGVVLPPTSDVGALRELVGGLTPTDAGVDLAGAVEAINRAAGVAVSGSDGPRVVVAILSDFLAGSVDVQTALGAIEPVPEVILTSEARAEGVDNVAIVGVEPMRSVVTGGRSLASSNQARVTLRRFGPSVGEPATRRVRLMMPEEGSRDGAMSTLDEGVARFEPGQIESTIIMRADTGPSASGGRTSQPIVAEIDADALPGDDTLRRVVEFRESIRVAVVSPRRFERAGGLDRFDAADWAALALEPTAPGLPGATTTRSDIEVSRVEPGAITTARLAGFDAAVLCAPQSLDATGWEAIGAFVRSGGLLVIVPPADVTTHVWTDRLGSTLGLDWSVAREPADADPALSIAAPSERVGGDDLLALVGAEVPELARPVGVRRRLVIEPGEAARTTTALALSDGSPLVVVGRPGGGSAEPGASPSAERGLVVLFATSLDLAWTDLPAKPLVVPLMQEVVRQGVGLSRGSWSSIAGARPTAPEGTVELRAIETGEGVESGASIAVGPAGVPPVRRAGLYRATDAGGATRATLVVETDPRASETGVVAPATVTGWVGAIGGGAPVRTIEAGEGGVGVGAASLSGALRSSERARDLGTALLFAVLALALLELVIARWSSHARRVTGGVDAGEPGAGADGGVGNSGGRASTLEAVA